MAPTCANPTCKKGSNKDLSACGGCKKVSYCCKKCQKQNWLDHKTFCKHITSGGTSSSTYSSLEYYKKVASHDPVVRTLAREICLALPVRGDVPAGGLSMPMRRLVVTGKDIPENMALFFGQHNSGEVKDIHKDIRLEVLLRPPPGSPMHAMSSSLNLDENCPPWTPRPTSTAEAHEIEEIRNMQEKVRQYMGSRTMGEITSKDTHGILSTFGNRWAEKVKVYQHAVNSMDRGV